MATSAVSSIAGLGSGLAPQAATNSTAQSSTSNSLDSMSSFMTMFVTQLKYQDPTNPMESYQLAAQLAQFSTVEKLTQATTTLNNLQNYASAINNAEMSSLVGKDVTANKSTIDVASDGTAGDLNYKLDSASSVTVTVKDAQGNTVYTADKGAQNSGNYKVGWNGKDAGGNAVPAGSYYCEVYATDTSGQVAALQTTIQGQVYSLNLTGTTPTYVLSGPNGVQINAADVCGVDQGNSTTPSTASSLASALSSLNPLNLL